MIHYDLPRRIDDYVHRSGRTGRFGRSGLALGFANGAAKGLAGELAKCLAEGGAKVPGWLLGMAISSGIQLEELQFLTSNISVPGASDGAPTVGKTETAYGAQDVRLNGAGLQTAEERREAQKLRSFAEDAYGMEKHS